MNAKERDMNVYLVPYNDVFDLTQLAISLDRWSQNIVCFKNGVFLNWKFNIVNGKK